MFRGIKMKKVEMVLSLLIGISISAVPARGALASQIESKSFQRPEPLIYEATRTDFQQIKVNKVDKSEEEPGNIYIDDGIPIELKEAAEHYGAEFNICPELIEAIAENESTFDTHAVNNSDIEHSVGIMQINLKCSEHQERLEKYGLTESDLQDINNSVLIACDILHERFNSYEDVGEVLIRYNGDKTGLKEYRKTGKLSDYANEILERAEELEILHGKKEQ